MTTKDSQQTRKEQISLWQKIVVDYTIRKIGDPEDRLPAIAGIVAKLETVWNNRCIAGLWVECLLENLFWSFGGNPLAPSRTQYLAPSWSWVSVNAIINFLPELERRDPRLRIIECSTMPVNTKVLLGKLKGGKLRVFWAFYIGGITATFKYDQNWFCVDISNRISFLQLGYRQGKANKDEQAIGLILVLEGYGHGRNALYKRIGVFYNSNPLEWDIAEQCIVSII
jgi:hypothetical protein